MTKTDVENLSEAYRDRNRVDEVKTILANRKCQECDRDISDQVIWNYEEFLYKEHLDWVIKNRDEVWPLDPKFDVDIPYKFTVHKGGDYGLLMGGEENE
jgi:hypothetical protein